MEKDGIENGKKVDEIRRIFQLNPKTGTLSVKNYASRLEKKAIGSDETIVKKLFPQKFPPETKDFLKIMANKLSNQKEERIGLRSEEMFVLSALKDLSTKQLSYTEDKIDKESKILFINDESLNDENKNSFIKNLKEKVDNLKISDCVHVCLGSVEDPKEMRAHVVDLCFYKNNGGKIGYFVYDPKGNRINPSNEHNLTKNICTVIKGVIPGNPVIIDNEESMNKTVMDSYFSDGAQSNIGNCAINVVNFVKSFEAQRSAGISAIDLLNSSVMKAVVLFETAVGTENDTNLALSQKTHSQTQSTIQLKSEIKETIMGEERNKYIEVIMAPNGRMKKTFFVPKERLNDGTILPEGLNAISHNKLLKSIGVRNVAINEFCANPNKSEEIMINSDGTIYYLLDQQKLDIAKLEQKANANSNRLSDILAGTSVQFRRTGRQLLGPLVGSKVGKIPEGEKPGVKVPQTPQAGRVPQTYLFQYNHD